MIEKVTSEKAPRPVGPYSQAIKAGEFLFISAQLGLDPSTSSLPPHLEDQARQVLLNIQVILEEAEIGWNDVVKVSLYVVDLSYLAKVNDIYAELLGEAKPARSSIVVGSLPRNALIAMDAIAYLS